MSRGNGRARGGLESGVERRGVGGQHDRDAPLVARKQHLGRSLALQDDQAHVPREVARLRGAALDNCADKRGALVRREAPG